MSQRGTAWVLLQDIGAFTALTERLEREGSEGVERLGRIIRGFFRDAETLLRPHGGRVMSLVGDAYWALLPPEHPPTTLETLASRLLELPVFRRHRLASRVIAVRGPVQVSQAVAAGGFSWNLAGLAVETAYTLEEKLEAGRAIQQLPATLPLPSLSHLTRGLPPYPLRILDLAVAFVEVSPETSPEDVLARFQEEEVFLAKWVPHPRRRIALAVAGYPFATGLEAQQLGRFLLKGRREGWILRAGASKGRVFTGRIRGNTFEELLFLGDPLNVAARLLALAQPGDLLLSFAESSWQFRDLGKQTLRGRNRPVHVVALEGLHRESEVREPPFTGREKEVQALHHHLATSNLVAVMGPVGVGKTRLVQEVLKNHPLPATWIRGYTAAAPLSGLRTLVRDLLVPSPLLQAYLEGRSTIPKDAIITTLREALLKGGPRVLVLDHLHGVDRATLDLLLPILQTPPPSLRIVLTLRGEHPVLEACSPAVLHLPPLPENTVLSLLENFAADIPPAHREEIARRCGGNLFCVFSLLWGLHHGTTLHGGNVYLSRVQHLSRRGLRSLEILACAGVPLREAELPRGWVGVRRELFEAGAIRETPEGMEIAGEPLAEALLSSVPPARKRRHFAFLADRGRKSGRDPQEIARWYTLARRLRDALPFWVEAAHRRYFQGLHDELDRMEQFLEETGRKFRSLRRLIAGLRRMREGVYEEAERIFQSLLHRKTLRKRALFGLVELYDWWGRYDRMKACLVALFPFRHSFSPWEHIHYRESLGIWHDMMGHHRKALFWYERCLTLAREHGYSSDVSSALFNIGWIHMKERRWEQAREYFLASLELAEHMFDRGAPLLRLGDVSFLLDEIPLALDFYREALEIFRTLRFSFWEHLALIQLVRAEAILGMEEEALAHAREADAFHPRGDQVMLFGAALLLGRKDLVRELLPQIRFPPYRLLGEMVLGLRPPDFAPFASLDPFLKKEAQWVLAHLGEG